MEKIDIVKRLVRANNYQHCDNTFKQCIELGIHVNREALERFSAKLELIDNAERQKARRNQQQKLTHPAPLTNPLTQPVKPGKPVPAQSRMSYDEIKQREAEITFELGTMKIREHQLLEELNSLSGKLDSKH